MSVAVAMRQTQGEFGGPDPAASPRPWPRLLRVFAAHGLAALLLVWPAFWNGYPLVFADSGTYLGQALLHYLGWDRPPFYSFFLLATHWGVSLWPCVLAQGLLVAHLLGLVLRGLGRTEPWALPLAAAGLALFTPLPFFVAQLMPDFLTGLLVLLAWLLGFRLAVLGGGERLYIGALSVFAVAAHQSHVPLMLGLAALGGAWLAWRRGWRLGGRAALRMAAPALLAALALLAVNGLGRGKASLSPYGAVFLATRALYDGPGLAVARERCPAVGWKLCAVLERLPGWHNGFLWAEDSPLQTELGGAEAWAGEAGELVWATLRARPWGMARAALLNTAEQLTLFQVGDGLEAWPPPHGPQPLVARFFPAELPALLHGAQQQGRLVAQARLLAPLHLAALLGGLGVLALLVTLRRQRLNASALALLLLVAGGVLGNAAITGALSGPAARYQARIIWLVPLLGGALLAGMRLPQPAPVPLWRRFTP